MVNKPIDINSLDLSNQSLTEVPRSVLKNLNLRELDLRNNALTELPDFLAELNHLEVLKLRNNKLTEAPSVILQLRKLKTLSLSENRIQIFPESLSSLSQLEDFDIGSNPLVEFPQWIYKLYVLKNLGIYDLKLEELPEVVTRLRYLEVLSLDGNKLTTLPESIENLRYLKALWAEGNCFEYLPESFGNLSQLERFNLGVNELKSLPESICNLRRLEYFDVSENKIQHLPSNIGWLSRLTNLDISYNEITSLPSSFSRLNSRTLEVWFEGNNFDDDTKKDIRRLFPNVRDYELEDATVSKLERGDVINLDTEDDFQQDVFEQSTTAKSQYKPLFFVFVVIGIFLLFFIMFLALKKDPLIEAHNESVKAYNAVLATYQTKRTKVFMKNTSMYVFTNDTTDLKLTLEPNIDVYVNPYAPSYSNIQSKTDALNEFMTDNSIGFNVILNNNRVRLIQARVYDSVFHKDHEKSYSLLVDYKIGDVERAAKKKQSAKYKSFQLKKEDTVFNSEKIILTSKELAEHKLSSSYRSVLAPIIDLNNSDYYFYFSSNTNNVTKEEFEQAVEDFQIMFLKDYDVENLGTIKNLELNVSQE